MLTTSRAWPEPVSRGETYGSKAKVKGAELKVKSRASRVSRYGQAETPGEHGAGGACIRMAGFLLPGSYGLVEPSDSVNV